MFDGSISISILDTQLLAQERRKVFSLDGSRKTVKKMDRLHGPTDADSDWVRNIEMGWGVGVPEITLDHRIAQEWSALGVETVQFPATGHQKTAETSGAISRWEKKPRKREH